MSFEDLTERAPGEVDALDLGKLAAPIAAAESAELEIDLAPGPECAKVSLDEIPLGSTAVLGAPDQLNPTILRLLEMGLTPGAPLQITRRAPGGDPVEVRVRGTRLCVRRADLARFAVASVTHAKAKSRTGK